MLVLKYFFKNMSHRFEAPQLFDQSKIGKRPKSSTERETLPYGAGEPVQARMAYNTVESSYPQTLRGKRGEYAAVAAGLIEKGIRAGKSYDEINEELEKRGLLAPEKSLDWKGKAPENSFDYVRKQIAEIEAKVELSPAMKEIAKNYQFYKFVKAQNIGAETQSMREDLVNDIAEAESARKALINYMDSYAGKMDMVINSMVYNISKDLEIDEADQDLVKRAIEKAYLRIASDKNKAA